MPDVARVPSRSDHRDRARPQDRRDAGDLRHRLPLIARRTVRRRRPQVDLDPHRRRAVAPGAAQAGRGEQLEQGRVLRPDLGGEAQDPPGPRVLRQALEQQGRDAVALAGAGHDEAGLGRRHPRAGTVIARQPDQLVRHQRHEGHPGVVVHLAEPGSGLEAESRAGQEHMLVRARRGGLAQSDQGRRVRRPDRADDDRLAVPQQPVEFPLSGITSRFRLWPGIPR